jgi:peptidoglycan-N-acetylglucosamine deacetylase
MAARETVTYITGPVSRLRMLSNGLLLAALAVGFIIVITSDGGARTSADGEISSVIASAAHETPTIKPPSAKAPTRKRPTAGASQKQPSAQAPRTPHPARPDDTPPADASPKQRSRQGDEPPPKRGGTVYLTFDDGPSQYTPAILNVLRATHSTATFFELGVLQARHPKEAAQIRAEGSNIGNHTYDHPDLTKLGPRQVQWQLAHGPRSACIRPPYGATNRRVERILSRQGLRQVLWTIDTRDWSRPGTKHIVAAATGPDVRPGSILLMHDGGGDRSQTIAALPYIIAALQHQGHLVRGIPGC